jgi:hypothetical protein
MEALVMAASLRFDAALVRKLMAHANRCREWSQSCFATDTPHPQLMLVKDEGIYLMSNGRPGLPDGEHVAFAIGYDPFKTDRMTVWDKAQEAAGSDDFVDYIDVAALEPIPENAEALCIKLYAKSMSIQWITRRQNPPTPRRSKPERGELP